MTDAERGELFSMAFNAGIATVTQVSEGYEGHVLRAVLNASHRVSIDRLGELLGKPPEDVALFIAPYAKPIQDIVDQAAKEQEGG